MQKEIFEIDTINRKKQAIRENLVPLSESQKEGLINTLEICLKLIESYTPEQIDKSIYVSNGESQELFIYNYGDATEILKRFRGETLVIYSDHLFIKESLIINQHSELVQIDVILDDFRNTPIYVEGHSDVILLIRFTKQFAEAVLTLRNQIS